jgi:hypothetical protein
MPDEHLSPEQAAGYLDGVLAVADRAAVEAHLAACSDCREEIVALRTVLKNVGPGRRLPAWTAAAGLAAAAALLVVVYTGDRGDGASPHRDRPPAELQGPLPVAPVGVGPRPKSFHWHPRSGAERYRISLFDSTGGLLFQTETEDTAASLPDSVPILTRVPLYWKAEGMTDVGRWEGSELVEFVVDDKPRESR